MIFNLLSLNKLGRVSQLICIPFLIATLFNAQVSAANLNNLQQQINESKQTKAQKLKQQRLLEEALSESEQTIAKVSQQVNETKNTIEEKRAALISLKKSTEQLEEDKIKQQSLLQQQLVSAYMTGQNDLIKLMLNQEDLSKIVRAKSYYQYLNEARVDSIESLHSTQQKLINNEKEQKATLITLEKMYQTQKERQETVSTQKNKRDKALKSLRNDINYQNKKLAELGDSEKALRERLKKAAEERKMQALAAAKAQAAKELEDQKKAKTQFLSQTKQKTISKLANQKGKLQWPIRGSVLHRFGSSRSRSSQVKWKGIAIAANEGEKVRAVATGRVLFAGYFKGYGMVIALDHSDNYITLYGYNQTVLQKAGDVVLQGDAIALAGHSGGQDRTSLYFELSHKGKAEDPLRWLTRNK
ncbi:peptidoglycan DD-metalloendopeptidase family protein [uncultured Psychromonas sp.]|uniref:murein hydrolase activator EnvC family protein n=1 Tax=uncultured Psychromonas sp. TaxID=173974 RepID=UPI0026089981|nr:peptidoglycan DD-metalloendopeptidase family protein [uncultured Psychromonas sp.]